MAVLEESSAAYCPDYVCVTCSTFTLRRG